jgi:hypothetical protein
MRVFATINGGRTSDDLFASDDDVKQYVGRSALTAIDRLLLLATHRPTVDWRADEMTPNVRFQFIQKAGGR